MKRHGLLQQNMLYRILSASFLVEWLLAFVLVLVARLPFLLSSHLYFDGDEAMVGIMGRDLISGVNLPIYFYGQQYGFSLFEAMACGLFIMFLGSSVWSLKLGGILLFSLGVQRLMRVFRKLNFSPTHYILIALIIVLFPTWVVWGTKLRGGYITAFIAASFIVEKLILLNYWNRKDWNVVAWLSALLMVSQAFFFILLAPVILKRFFKLRLQDGIRVIANGLLVLILLRLPAYLNPSIWNPTTIWRFSFEALDNYLIHGFWSSFTGYFAFTDIYGVPNVVKYSAALFIVIALTLLAYSLSKLRNQKRAELLYLLIGTFVSLVPISVFGVPGSRYLIPFFTGLLLCLVWCFAHLELFKKKVAVIGLGLLFLFSLPIQSGYEKYVSFWLAHELNDMQAINELMEELDKQQIDHAFVSEWQVTLQLNYLMEERAHFRYLHNNDRCERYAESVKACYHDTICTLGLTGSLWPLGEMHHEEGWEDRIIRVNERFYLMVNPEDRFLEAGGFELPKD